MALAVDTPVRVAFNLYGALLRNLIGIDAVKTLLSIFGLASATVTRAESAELAVTPPVTVIPFNPVPGPLERMSKDGATVTLKSTVPAPTTCALTATPSIKQKTRAKAILIVFFIFL